MNMTVAADSALDSVLQTLRDNRRGKKRGIYSVCSSHQLVLTAAMARAREDHEMLVLESTSNQVDQFGGYTGMTPQAFATWARRLADTEGLGGEHVLLGGDHLGPNAWRQKPAEEAMALAEELVRQYVLAGFQKIHLDCSMPLGGDAVAPDQPLDDTIVAERAAQLCRVAEAAAEGLPRQPVYVIGTEVPVPGGSTRHEEHVPCTSRAAVEATIATTREKFAAAGVGQAWGRVVGVVVQPGVEFGDDFVCDFRPEAAHDLSAAVLAHPGLVYEAHSTDYQTLASLDALVRGHFAILKVGPWLTFAMREGLFALANIEEALATSGRIANPSRLQHTIAGRMATEPKWWQGHYRDDIAFKQRFSYSDRIRYYWGDAAISAAVDTLFANLECSGIPASLLSQFMPEAFPPVRERLLPARPRDLIRFHIDRVLRRYASACGQLAESP